jgi:hypothetical protein
MDVEKENKDLKESERQQERAIVYSCWPTGAYASRFWGVLLVVIGGIWLLGNFGLATTLLWPLFFIGFGLFYLSRARSDRYS